MPDKMTLDEMEQICEAATPGPWGWDNENWEPDGFLTWIGELIGNDGKTGVLSTMNTENDPGELPNIAAWKPSDAAFITAARTHWPEAIRMAREAHEKAKEAHLSLIFHLSEQTLLQEENAELKHDNAALQKRVAELERELWDSNERNKAVWELVPQEAEQEGANERD